MFEKFINFISLKKYFFRYCIIGIISISFELIIRLILININLNSNFSSFLALFFGINLAFILNIKYNFTIPRYYYKNSFLLNES